MLLLKEVNINNIKRKLIIERAFLSRPDSYAILIAIIKGTINPEQFRVVLQKLYEKLPILNTHIEIDEKHHAWLVSNNESLISLRFDEIKEENDWIKEVLDEYRSFFSLKIGPLIRFSLLKKQDDSILIISAYHLLIDGISLPYILHYILKFIANPGLAVNPELTPPLHEKIPLPIKLSLDQKIINKVATILWNRRKKKGMAFGLEDYHKIHSKYCPILQKDLQIIAFPFSEEQTANLIRKCKQENVSVNSAICSAFIMADHEVLKNKKKTKIKTKTKTYSNKILLPINIRDILSLPRDAIGLYVSTIDITLKHTTKKKSLSFWDFAKFSHKLIQKSMNSQIILNLLGRVLEVPEQIPDAAFFAKYDIVKDWFLDLCLRTTKLDKINYNYSISNLGKFIFPTQYKNLAVEKVYFHTYGEMAEKQLTALTIADKLTFCLSFRESITEKVNAKEIMDVALKYLIS